MSTATSYRIQVVADLSPKPATKSTVSSTVDFVAYLPLVSATVDFVASLQRALLAFLSRVSVLTRDIYIAILSVRP